MFSLLPAGSWQRRMAALPCGTLAQRRPPASPQAHNQGVGDRGGCSPLAAISQLLSQLTIQGLSKRQLLRRAAAHAAVLGRGARRPGRRGLMSNEPDSCTRATPSWGGQDRLQQVCSKPDQHEARRPASWCLFVILFFLSLRRKARSAGCMFRNIRARTQSNCAVRLRALRTPRCARIHSRRPMPPAHRERRLAIAERESPHSAVPSAA